MTAISTTKTNSGFLLTRQVQDTPSGLQITLWLKGKSGPVKLQIENELALFFIEESYVNFALGLLKRQNIALEKHKSLTLKTFSHTKVCCLYFCSLRNFYRAREILNRNNIKCYEDDIRPDDRFLMERFITSHIDYLFLQDPRMSSSNTNRYLYPNKHVIGSEVKCKRTVSPENINLTMLSIDIECSMQGELYSIGLYANNDETFKCVLMIGDEQKDTDIYIKWQQNEKELLRQFVKEVIEFDADILIGWNVIDFDFVLLQKRCDLWNIDLAIGRDGSSPNWRKNPNNSDQHFIEIAGRVVLDGIDLLKTATYSFPSYSLDNVAKSLLGLNKKVTDVDNRVKEITDNFNHNKRALAEYNLEDCRLVWLIFEKTQLLSFAKLRAQLTGLPIDRVGGSVAAFTNLYLPKLHRSGYVAPNMGDGESDLISPGGYVMDSIPGLYDNVLVLDFKSLYPSIIRTFKIDPMGLIEGLKLVSDIQIIDDTGNTENFNKKIDPIFNEIISGYDGAFFSRKHHFLPDIIQRLWLERDKAKLDNNSALSQAIKIIMNSFYGVLGSTGCRFFDPRLSGSITKRSHDILKKTSHWIEDKGHQVIYGDTDSIFVAIGVDKTQDEAKLLGKSLQEYINEKWQYTLQENLNISSELEIEFETHFTKFLMPTIRGGNLNKGKNNVGTKKRYAGLSNGKLVFKGLETVRSDWTELSKDFQQMLYKMVFNNEPVDEFIVKIVHELRQGFYDQKLIYTKRIRRRIEDYVNTPPHIKAALIANEQLIKQGVEKRYRHRSTIQYVITINGVQPLEFHESKLDYDFYIEKQLKPIADDILPFIDTNFDSIAGNQMGLF